MNREIKFRVWVEENKCMKIVSELDFAYYKSQSKDYKPQGQLSDIWLDDENKCYFPCEVELMQYTGLKDKNDKEIYEGDILQSISSENIYKVVFNRGCFVIADIRVPNANLGLADCISEYSEIIGNVYENPELLEA